MYTNEEKHKYWDSNPKSELVTSLNNQELKIQYQLIPKHKKDDFFPYFNTGCVLHHQPSNEILIFILDSGERFFESTIVHEYFEGVAFREGFFFDEFETLAHKYLDYFKEAYRNEHDDILDDSIKHIKKVMNSEDGCHYFAMLKEVEYVFEHYLEDKRRLHQEDIYEHDRLAILEW